MLLGVIGPHATGKSTYHRHLAGLYQSGAILPRFALKIILADNGFILHKDGEDKVKWTKGLRAEKEPYIENMVADDTTVYILESARFFGGLMPYVKELFDTYNGGARFVLASVTYERMIENMRGRCDKTGKEFKEEFWADRAQYENRDRYLNQLMKQGGNIPWIEFDVPTYATWYETIHPEILRILQLPYEEWYICS